uniref:CXXC-type zinc finger protein 1 n=1 Tax=Henneguya salminicola TaxID=69463 RepID=A0A6G3MHX9_HENSL
MVLENKVQQCLEPQCLNAAIPNSKYCSQECGVKLAKTRINRLLIPKLNKYESILIKQEEETYNKIENIKQEQQKYKSLLDIVEGDLKSLEDNIQNKKQISYHKVDGGSTDVEEESTDSVIFCFTCGIPLPFKTSIRHMEKCFMKAECTISYVSNYSSSNLIFCEYYDPIQRTYCKRLKYMCYEHQKSEKVNHIVIYIYI